MFVGFTISYFARVHSMGRPFKSLLILSFFFLSVILSSCGDDEVERN